MRQVKREYVEFVQVINRWYRHHRRDLPWRGAQEPYVIWLSEIILQQTRVAQGLPYFQAFLESFPTIESLAQAEEEEVLRLWQGLGYYSRARNLHKCANQLVRESGGRFPETFSELKKLPGIGPYTAAAIASICFSEPVPVLDGNVFRVLARYFGITADISKSAARPVFFELASDLIPNENPGNFNQAMMEYGARLCTPVNPDCTVCDLQYSCYAFINRMQSTLPVKSKSGTSRERHFNYYVIKSGESLMMRRREASDIWKGLYEFYLIEGPGSIAAEEALDYLPESLAQQVKLVSNNQPIIKHVLSHQRIFASFHELEVDESVQTSELGELLGTKAFVLSEIDSLPKPVLIDRYLKARWK